MLFLAYWKTAWVRMNSPSKSQKYRSIVVAFSHGEAKGTASPLSQVLETWVGDRETETEEQRVLKSQVRSIPYQGEAWSAGPGSVLSGPASSCPPSLLSTTCKGDFSTFWSRAVGGLGPSRGVRIGDGVPSKKIKGN